jgi:hypothetical protein
MNSWLVANSLNYESVSSMYDMSMNFIVYPELAFYTENDPLYLSFDTATALFAVSYEPSDTTTLMQPQNMYDFLF